MRISFSLNWYKVFFLNHLKPTLIHFQDIETCFQLDFFLPPRNVSPWLLTYTGEDWAAPIGGKSSKLLKLSCTCVGGDTGSILPAPLLLLPPPSQRPPSSDTAHRVPVWRPGAHPPLLMRPLCCCAEGLGCVSEGDVMKSPRLGRWAERRSEGVLWRAGLHTELKEGLLRALTPLKQWEPVNGVSCSPLPPTGDTDGAREKSWTRLALRGAWTGVDFLPLRSEVSRVLIDLEVLGVLAGVVGPWVKVWLLWSLKKFNRKGTNSSLLNLNGKFWDSQTWQDKKKHQI